MSVDENSTDYDCNDDIDEKNIFVELLSKYKIVLEKRNKAVNSNQKLNALRALAKEYNKKCQREFTASQMLTKIRNTKSRLKEKHYKNISKWWQRPYAEWERKFLDLWDGHGITIQETNASDEIRVTPENKTSEKDTEIKLEEDCYLDSISKHSAENDEYKNLSIKQLKRSVLIRQVKTFRALEASAKAEEMLKLYKLSLMHPNKF